MSVEVDKLEERLFGLRGERAGLEATLTREDIVSSVDAWLEAARVRAAGSSTFVLNGQPVGEHLEALLAEDLLDDEALAARVVKRLEVRGFGAVSARAKKQSVEKDLLAVRKREALERVEAEFAASGEAA
jgi:hypothetical protein